MNTINFPVYTRVCLGINSCIHSIGFEIEKQQNKMGVDTVDPNNAVSKNCTFFGFYFSFSNAPEDAILFFSYKTLERDE